MHCMCGNPTFNLAATIYIVHTTSLVRVEELEDGRSNRIIPGHPLTCTQRTCLFVSVRSSGRCPLLYYYHYACTCWLPRRRAGPRRFNSSIAWTDSASTVSDGSIMRAATADSLRSAGWSWRLELEWCERKILLGWLEVEPVAGMV